MWLADLTRLFHLQLPVLKRGRGKFKLLMSLNLHVMEILNERNVQMLSFTSANDIPSPKRDLNKNLSKKHQTHWVF